MAGNGFLEFSYPNLYRRLDEIAAHKETKAKNEKLIKVLEKKLAVCQARKLEGGQKTVEKGGKDDKVQGADQALGDKRLEEEPKATEKGGKHDKVHVADQAPLDLLYGILRDWTYIAAGAPGPWTGHPQTPLGTLVSRWSELIKPTNPVSKQPESSRPAAEVWIAPGSFECLPTLTVLTNTHSIDPVHRRDLPVHMGMTIVDFPESPYRSSLLEEHLSHYNRHAIANNTSLAAQHHAQLALFALSPATHPSSEIMPSGAASDSDCLLAESFATATPNSTDLEIHTLETLSIMKGELPLDPLWVKNLPVECFGAVAKYLSREDLKACLETCKDFNRKFGPSFFQQVVLQFDTQTFESVNGHDTTSSTEKRVPKLHMFQSWGASIKKLGFSLEVSEGKTESLLQAQLNLTPPTTDEEPSLSFYPRTFVWPKAHSYVDPSIKMLEIAAEKIKPIQEAIACLTEVNELALSLDSGLGFLSGPDASDRVRILTDKSEVFGRKYTPSREHMAREWLESLERKVSDLPKAAKYNFAIYEKCLQLVSPRYSHYHHIVVDYMTKYTRGSLEIVDSQVKEYVEQHMKCYELLGAGEEPRISNDIVALLKAAIDHMETGFVEPMPKASSVPEDPMLRRSCQEVQRHEAASRMMDYRQYTAFTTSPFLGAASTIVTRHLGRRQLRRLVSTEPTTAAFFDGIDYQRERDPSLDAEMARLPSFQPNNLSLRQKQWLKEFGWVQHALIGSLTTAVIRNSNNLTTIQTLNLAKLSSSFLGRLYDDDFWNSLPNLCELIITVSPDWREIVAAYEGDFRARAVNPSSTATSFYQLLIGLSKKSFIKTLTLGYAGGGEHATGLFARNQHILPAPIVDGSAETTIIAFPHVRNLTFKNCWFVPAVLHAFARTMEYLPLKTLKFESVSLLVGGGKSTNPQFTAATWPSGFPLQRQDGITPSFVGFGVPQPSASNLLLATTVEPPLLDENGEFCIAENAKWEHQMPQAHTWARFINDFTPSLTVDEKRANWPELKFRKRKRAMEKAIRELGAKRGKIPLIEFVSCGYVKLVLQDLGDSYNLLASRVALPRTDNNQLMTRKARLTPYMMESDDPFLADIFPLISKHEGMLLTEAFGMTLGWGDDHRQYWNGEDGKDVGGTGRFSGVVQLDEYDEGDDSSDGDVT